MFPAAAVAKECLSRGAEVTLITDPRGARFVEEKAFSRVLVLSTGGCLDFLSAAMKALWFLVRNRPHAVWGFGGRCSFFPLIWAWGLRIPTGLHESNGVLGRTNRFLARRMGSVALAHEKTVRVPDGVCAVVVGTPVRQRFISSPLPNFSPFRLCVLGGSQGATFWDRIVPAALALLPNREQIVVVHQCRDVQAVETSYREVGIMATCFAFSACMEEIFANSHLILSRAGGSTVAELMASGRPAILVPYPASADQHQEANARWVVDAGAGWMFNERDLSPEGLARMLKVLKDDPAQLTEAARCMTALHCPQACEKLTDLILGASL